MSGLRSDVIVAVGRVCLAAIFIMSGLYKIFDFTGTVDKIIDETLIQPYSFAVAVTCIVIVLETVGGLSVAFGYKTAYGAMLLMVFLVPATLMIHNFWVLSEGDRKMIEMGLFMRNVSIFGGLLILSVTDPGRFSVDD